MSRSPPPLSPSRSPSPLHHAMSVPQQFSTVYDLTSNGYALPGTADYPEPLCPSVFRPSYIISIRQPRFEDLARRMGPWMAHCRRAPCVLGMTLNKNHLQQNRTLSPSSEPLTLGQIGCWLSHYHAWEAVARSPCEFGTVLEDDVAITSSTGVADRVNQAWEELEKNHIDWDVLFWCISPLPHVAGGLQTCELTHWYRVPPMHCMGCVAYTMKKSVAQSWVRRAKPIRNPVDVWVAQDFGRLKVYCIKPVLGFIVPTGSDTAHSPRPGYLKFLR